MPVPSSFTLSLHSLDGLRDFNSLKTEVETTGNFLTLYILSGLPPNRLWDYTVMAYGCQQVTVQSGTTISKFTTELGLEIELHDMCTHLTKNSY